MRSFRKTYTTNGENGGQELFVHEYDYALVPIDNDTDYTYLQNLQYRFATKLPYFIGDEGIENKELYYVEGNVCISAFKPCQKGEGKILRLYNLTNIEQNVDIKTEANNKLFVCDFYENEKSTIDNRFTIKPREIVTIKII